MIRIMHGFKICISDFSVSVIHILLDAAATAFLDDMGFFSVGLAV